MRYVENEGALFRITGPSNAFPDEVWDRREGKFFPYEGDVPKPPGWGSDVSKEEVRELIGGGDAGSPVSGAAAE
jgi:hypothetical protein